MTSLFRYLFRFKCHATRASSCRNLPGRIVALTWGDNPTFDYYLRPRLSELAHCVVDISQRNSTAFQLNDGDYIIACRYITLGWAVKLRLARGLSGFGLLFDDDYAAFLDDPRIAPAYRLSIAWRAGLPMLFAGARLTDLFVSTPVLQQRYAEGRARILHPAPGSGDLKYMRLGRDSAGENDRVSVVAFHAQLSHLADHELAARVCRRIADLHYSVRFDVIGPGAARQLWRETPNVSFTDELDWRTYRTVTACNGADVLIAPMYDTPVNQARAPTKAIDAVRMGACAVFPDMAPYRNVAGACLTAPTDEIAWANAVVTLLRDDKMRQESAEALRRTVRLWGGDVTTLFGNVE